MLFNIEQDHGDHLIGYVVPDNASDVPDIELYSEGHLLLEMQVNEVRDALVIAGRHLTGRCGFRIDSSMIPGLADCADLAIREKDTGLLIYRRPHPLHLQRRILRLDTSLYPLLRIDNHLKSLFQYFQIGIDQFGRETVTQLFLLNAISSVYLSGRILYNNYVMYIDEIFDCYTMIQDPYEEFAERLLILAKLSKIGAHHIGERDAVRMAPAIAYAGALAFQDQRKLRKQLLDMPIEVAHLMVNPLARQFTASTLDELPPRRAIARTLEVLSKFKVVGLRSRSDEFIDSLAASLDIGAEQFPQLDLFSATQRLGRAIREMRCVDHLLELDVEIFEHIRVAVEGE
jgi:hypothetical protein